MGERIMFRAYSIDESECLKDVHYLINKYNEINILNNTYALVLLNIKNFRYFNSKFGTDAGDQILQIIFNELNKWLNNDEYAGYLYSDNFVFLVQSNSIDVLVYERLMSLIEQLYRIPDERIYRNLFMSMGIYPLKAPSVSFYDAVHYANLCRKETQNLDKRCSSMEVYEEKFMSRYMNQMELEIKTADAYKNYEFINYIQPKVDLKTERVVGGEALLRWFDKEGRSIPLSDFLPILEENSYIQLIDLDTFEQLCQYLQNRLNNKEKVVPISFNISKCYFQDPNVVQDYINVFEKFKIPKDLVEIEFMESISFSDKDQVVKIVSQFKEYGFTCSLDDFGNGYSSFGVLLNTPLDVIKMDRQFFMNNLNGDSELIIKSIVSLIHSLKMKVVAEGVDTEEHIQWLKSCHCDYVQGYYYYKPMPLDEFSQLLDN